MENDKIEENQFIMRLKIENKKIDLVERMNETLERRNHHIRNKIQK
jgi:hypothetical protein